MDAPAKILRFLAERGIKDAEFASLANIPKSFLSNLRAGKVKLTLTQGQRAARAMGVTLDYLFDDRQGWPPPPEAEQRVTLTNAERELIRDAHRLCRDDPELTEAFDRLWLRGYRVVAASPIDLQPPPGRSHGETKNGPGKKSPGPTS